MDGSDDSEMEWEQIIPNDQTADTAGASTSNAPFEITIKAPVREPSQKEKRQEKSQADALKRVIRLGSHRLHTLALLANASIRNKWLNDELLQARLLSLTPMPFQTSFAMISRHNQPDKGLRGRQFEAALSRLAEWWTLQFRVNHNEGIRHQTYESAAASLPTSTTDTKGKGKARELDENLLKGGEQVRTVNSMMKHALQMRGSPDMSAQLFCALCRSLGLPARLVASLQPVLWRREKTEKEKAVDKAVKKTRDAIKAKEALVREAALVSAAARNASGRPSGQTTGARMDTGPNTPNGNSAAPESIAGPSTAASSDTSPSKASTPAVRLRKTRPAGRTLGKSKELHIEPDKKESPPVFWVEVYSRPDGRWLPVNPISGSVDKRTFEPTPTDKYNHMLYVVAFEEDGYVRDVTPRYCKNFITRIMKERSSKGKDEWWNLVLVFLTRPYRLHRDDVEEAEFESLQAIEGMPTSMGAFKNHPVYALERHLHQDEVIHPRTPVGNFRGEPVFARHSVTSLKSAENWLRSSGRTIRSGAQPLKMGKVRAATLNKKRAVEMAAAEAAASGQPNDANVMQGLYAHWQTEPFVPEPVVEGQIPKNEFGNIDLYTPSMLPAGAAHVPYKGTAKIARQLGIDYAEAVTGFEFKQRRAFPILTGVVVPVEREAELLEAYEASAQAAEEKERKKKNERVIKHWTKIIQGLRIRDRLKAQYAENATPITVAVDKSDEEGGGFLNEADTHAGLEGLGSRVAKFDLPKMVSSARISNPLVDPRSLPALEGDSDDEELEQILPPRNGAASVHASYPAPTQASEPEHEARPRPAGLVPKTMTEFAEARLVPEDIASSSNDSDVEDENEDGPAISVNESSPRRPARTQKAESPLKPSRPTLRAKRPRASTNTASNGRTPKKRRRGHVETDSDAEVTERSGSDAEEDFVEPATPAKRPGRQTRGNVKPKPVEVPKSDRVLRSRPSRG